MKNFLLALPVALALAIAGCGSSSSSNDNSTSTPSANPAPAASGGGSGGTTVDMKNIQFAPKSITVKVGQKITWKNSDAVAHNVTAKSGETFHSSTMNQNATYSFTPKKAGTISYVCTFHPGMDGTITVTG